MVGSYKLCLLEDLVVDVDLDEARDEVGRAVRCRVRGVKHTDGTYPYPYPYPYS